MTPSPLLRRSSLAALAILSALALGAVPGQAANPFVAGGLSTRTIPVDRAATDSAEARGRAVGAALGLPGVRHAAQRVTDAFDHRIYDEVTAFDGGGREVAITRFDVDGPVAMAVVLGWHQQGGPAIDGPAAQNRAVAAIRAAGLGVTGRAVVQASAGAGGWSISWPRVAGGVAVRGDGLRVLLFADGTFHGLTRTERPLGAGPSRLIGADAARTTATSVLTGVGGDPADLTVAGVERAWIAPNDTFGGARLDAPAEVLRLAWTVRFETRNGLADRLRAVEVWIDAGDGSLLGGDAVE